MENAADALKIAFGIFVFVIAITMLFMMVSKAKSTSDVVLYYSDNTNFYDHYDYTKEGLRDKKGNRIVEVADIVATLYRYYNESVAVTVVLERGNPDKTYNFDLEYESILDNNGKIIRVSDGTGKELLKLGTKQNIEENLGKFITKVLYELGEDVKFTEEFTEVPTSGIYDIGEDGSEIVLSSGGKKVYITYTKM